MNPVTASRRSRDWPFLLVLLAALGLSACSAPQSVATRDMSVAEASPPPSASARMAAPAAAKAQSTLGTQWGEGRESVTKVVKASRITPDRARAVAQMRYSDEDSIRRALGRQAERQTDVLLGDGDVEWMLSSGSGPALPIFTTRGGSDYQVAGRNGERYELVYHNRSNRYYEVVATVDGLDVLTGQPGSVKSDGYLLRPGERLVIDGFRKSDKEVAAFRFSAKGRAYANNTPAGEARNVGVIGTALFEIRLDERDPDLPRRSMENHLLEPSAFPADPGKFAPAPQYVR